MMNKKKLVLVGNGMAGMNTIEQLLKLAPHAYDITVFGDESYPNYNRIQLSYVLEGSKTADDIILNERSWYEENGIQLYTGNEVTKIDTEHKTVHTANGTTVPYDALIIATGSKPIMLPVPGEQLNGVIGFRDIHDCETMKEAAKEYRKAAVIGGGLLGLEAAKGLVALGMDVTVVHLMQDLMERQLDSTAADMLKRKLESQGIKFMMGAKTEEITGSERVTGLRFADGQTLEAELVVMAVGIRPNTKLAMNSGIAVGRGILVDDELRTSVPDVYAVGECSEHRGVCYGLVAPLFEQGQVLARTLTGVQGKKYEGSVVSTKLKISGVDVFSAGEFLDAPKLQAVCVKDEWANTYKKLLLRDGRIAGAVLFGDVTESVRIAKWVQTGERMTEELHAAFVGKGCCGSESKADLVATMTDDEIVCGCNGVTKGMIVGVIRDKGLTTVEEIKLCTGASRSCGGCKPTVEAILAYVLGDQYEAGEKKEAICGCTRLSRDEIVAAIREKRLVHVQEVMNVLGWSQPEGCSKCRPALNYYLGMIWPQDHEDEPDSRFVNERLHANIQHDGTYSVIPRIYGGVTSPHELRRIADVADKYEINMVKFTGGQRIALLGAKKEDLPVIWKELELPSGYGYAKSLRTVKTCVGSTFCRFGTQDSMGVGIKIEKKFERLPLPAKFKMAVNGCPRNCAESGTKDIGIVGNDGGWELYVGGNGGIKLRGADLLCKVKTDDELMQITAALIQYYRENGKYGERTSDFVERIGLQAIHETVVTDLATREALAARCEQALERLEDPWQHAIREDTVRHDLYEKIRVLENVGK